MFSRARNNPVQREIWNDFAQAENDKTAYFTKLVEKSSFLQEIQRQADESMASDLAAHKAAIAVARQAAAKKPSLHAS